jgi:3-(3-hydroxy-phenyl)propionate hydroxylase
MLGLDIEGKHLHGPLPDRRRGDEGRLPGRALVLVRPAVPPQPVGAAAQAGDNVWRIDFQLGWDADPEEEKKPENVIPRIKAMLGDDRVRAGMGQRLHLPVPAHEGFRHGRVLFVGDAAHQVSPFGARGANAAFQDTDNLAWKLKAGDGRQGARGAARHLQRRARTFAADENLMNSTRSTDFITPKSAHQQALSQRGARAGAGSPLCAPAGQLRPPVGAGFLTIRP